MRVHPQQQRWRARRGMEGEAATGSKAALEEEVQELLVEGAAALELFDAVAGALLLLLALLEAVLLPLLDFDVDFFVVLLEDFLVVVVAAAAGNGSAAVSPRAWTRAPRRGAQFELAWVDGE